MTPPQTSAAVAAEAEVVEVPPVAVKVVESAPPAPPEPEPLGLPEDLLALLSCLGCGESLKAQSVPGSPSYPELGPDGVLICRGCGERYPIIGGTPRMLPAEVRPRLWVQYPLATAALRAARVEHPAPETNGWEDVRQRTAQSFQYEWEHFGGLRPEWAKNFADYMQPHAPESLKGRLVLDVGTGSGRHAFHAACAGARVVAVDLGGAIDVARRNLPPEALTVQADAELLPFPPQTFDLVMSIGVLHHLPDPQAGLSHIALMAKRDGHVHVYLYWVPERAGHVHMLRLVTLARRFTVRLPHRPLHALCLPLAGALAVCFVWPYKLLRRSDRLAPVAAAFPLKTYADYPFTVLVNDQFDRFSAPVETRYRREEVAAMLDEAGLEDVVVLPNHGWIGDGRPPAQG
jgi:ubiquinone/menaquinone biosynthesis C-methylase UbiE/uncharacterized protein YbaR (Trm112 family)